jgi:hypothetical protein
MVQKIALETLMSDITSAHRPVELGSGEAAMSRLADRLAALAPPPMDLPSNSIMRPSPAVAAAMATSQAISKRAAERARRSRSVTGLLVDGARWSLHRQQHREVEIVDVERHQRAGDPALPVEEEHPRHQQAQPESNQRAILLVLGFATRFAALGLLLVTALQFYLMPAGLWTAQVYWAAILLVLLSRGAGQLSIDHIIRLIARR